MIQEVLSISTNHVGFEPDPPKDTEEGDKGRESVDICRD
jgi:hypothetical protein